MFIINYHHSQQNHTFIAFHKIKLIAIESSEPLSLDYIDLTLKLAHNSINVNLKRASQLTELGPRIAFARIQDNLTW